MPRITKTLPHIPAERALKVISGRWKVVILFYLFEQPRRLSELRRLAPGSSQKMLVQQLRELEAHGIVSRKVFAEVPARVEYSATRLGMSLRADRRSLVRLGQTPRRGLGAPGIRVHAGFPTPTGIRSFAG